MRCMYSHLYSPYTQVYVFPYRGIHIHVGTGIHLPTPNPGRP